MLEASSQSAAEAMPRPSIAIIGAGVSGLRCADLLLRASCNVTILEARSRLGGRVNQVLTGGHLVDTGSNWIHGTKGNPIMHLAEKTRTTVMEPPENSQTVYDTQGVSMNRDRSFELAGKFWEWIVKGLEYSSENSRSIPKDLGLLEWLTREWKEYRKASLKNGKQVDIAELTEECRRWGQFVGSPIEKQSMRFFWLEDGVDGGNVFVASTYEKILAEIKRPAEQGANIKLETEVKHIVYRDKKGDDKIRVETKSGQILEFDEVVVTCPLGWLKRHQADSFTPRLPERLVQAIDNIGYGALEKLYITFPKAFWLTDDNPSTGSCFNDFHNPTGYHPYLVVSGTKTTSWNQSVLSLAHLPGSTAQPTLLFYMMGDAGAHVTSQVSHLEPHSKAYNEALHDFALPFYSRLPNFDAKKVECVPTSFYQTVWQADEFAGYGSYSTFRVGLDQADVDIETMRNCGGLGEDGRGLWLAGEHTAPFIALGTTTGAFWSGEGVARKIIDRYGLSCAADELETIGAEVKNSDENPHRDTGSAQGNEPNPGNNMNGGTGAGYNQ